MTGSPVTEADGPGGARGQRPERGQDKPTQAAQPAHASSAKGPGGNAGGPAFSFFPQKQRTEQSHQPAVKFGRALVTTVRR